MNMLDRLFSREINRRTGAHAISIYIDSATKTRKRSRSIGSSAIKASSNKNRTKTRITTKRAERSFFYRLNVRFPWLKLIIICLVGALAVIDLCDLTISKTGDPTSKVRIAPMAKHVKATDRVLKGKMLAALTFDDGPSPETTPKLLDILQQKDVPATFFMLGNQAATYPDIVKRAVKEAHEVASHTMYHQNLIRITTDAAVSDINESKATFKKLLGHDPIYTRPPYGNINDTVRTTVGTPMILWSVDTEDWKSKNVDSIIATTMREIHDGAIILMHDIYPTTLDAVPILIDTLRKNGYELATVSELAKIRGIKLENGATYYNFRP